ncbi:hypothetical protein SCLCIDRAFT_1222418 [Scleroderma citrinum Foug A]|uniref:Protein kinase domain-containing protein n=1 Tax=Scleroderma citrinum Foug A TaxID=1036808 RepID=A0A0C3DD31_9AGAM|nr:hypothetical protein SCLCIDRAFT_1222418 [Scleroderma citrinum Foug A]
MKRGFLKTDKAKNALGKECLLESDRSPPGGKKMATPKQEPEFVPTENQSAEDKPNSSKQLPQDPFVHADLNITPFTDLHRLPPCIASKYKNKRRAVFCGWPRDPNGKPLGLPGSNIHGKETPNGFLSWGATLYDFYYVRAIPHVENLLDMTSGSRIAAAVRVLGETDVAADELAWADQEADPYEVPVADPGELIQSSELRMSIGIYNKFSAVDEVRTRTTAKDDSNSTKHPPNDGNSRAEVNRNDAPWNGIASVLMLDRPLSSPFHPSHYPQPWPFIPFSCPKTLLQKRIPLHLLPETLYVHDPYDLLSVSESTLDYPQPEATTPWLEKPPKVHQYKLKLISSARNTVKKARKEAKEEARKEARVLHVYRFMPTEEERTRGEPAYEVPLPTKPPALRRVEEAHLYLSPAGELGTGHHSVVYNAEFELPRDLFLEPQICSTCVFEELQKETRKLKKSGKWKTMLQAAGCERPPESEAEGSPDENYEIPVPPDPNEEFDAEQITVIQRTPCNSKGSPPPPEVTPYVFRVHCPDIQWQNPKAPCTHVTHRIRPHPRTAMFQVVAKLSVQHDAHLEREARNYQSFPDHFFQHWNGYNLVRPLHGPVPVHALVPQFYGYYIPKDIPVPTASSDEDESDRPYLSPILLLENCGVPVVPSKLSKDDREECVSLLLRFNNADWLHDSVAERNFLVQRGPPTMWPLERTITDQLSFRLIDFGRSRLVEDPEDFEFLMAKDKAMKLFKMMFGLFE